jgi:hypothetical protein
MTALGGKRTFAAAEDDRLAKRAVDQTIPVTSSSFFDILVLRGV